MSNYDINEESFEDGFKCGKGSIMKSGEFRRDCGIGGCNEMGCMIIGVWEGS